MAKTNKHLVSVLVEMEAQLIKQDPAIQDFFPVIRSFVYFSVQSASKNKSSGFIKAIKAMFAAGRSALDFFFFIVSIRRSSKSYLLVAPAQHRNVPCKAGYVSKHLDTLSEYYGPEQCQILELGEARFNRAPYSNLSLFMHLLSLIGNLDRKATNECKQLAGKVLENLPEQIAGVKLSRLRLEKVLLNYQVQTRIYRWIFRHAKYKRCIFVAYYTYETLAMIGALNMLNIKTADYQHGIQSDYHPLYTNWRVNEGKPVSMPDCFMVWDPVAHARIAPWATRIGVNIEIKGNLWIESDFGSSRYLKECGTNTSDDIILVALQLWPDYFNKEVLDVVRKYPQKNWVFRQHPKSPVPIEEQQALKKNYPNIVFEATTERSLDEALRCCAICITGFSTAGIEANYYGKKAVFTHKNALEGLSAYIDSEKCFYAGDAEALARILEEVFT